MDTEQIISQFGENVIERAQRNLGAFRTINGKKRRRVASAAPNSLKDKLGYTVKKNVKGGKLSIQFGVTDKSKELQALAVEYGRGKNKKPPPTKAIRKWIDDKPIRMRNSEGSFVKATESMKQGLAFVIARRIGKEGFPGIYFMRDAVRDELNEGGEAGILKVGDAFITEIGNFYNTLNIKVKG